MLSDHLLQKTIEGIKDIAQVEMAVFDTHGNMLASTEGEEKFVAANTISAFVTSNESESASGGFLLFRINDAQDSDLVLALKERNSQTKIVGKMAAFQLRNLSTAYRDRFDRENFIKNLLLDNLLLVDVYNRAKKYNIKVSVDRVVMILETNPDKEQGTLENIRLLIGNKAHDFVTAIDENSIIIIKELPDGEGYPYVEKVASTVLGVVGSDKETHMAYGTIVKEFKDVSRSYKEARMALDVGKIFFVEKSIIAYNTLGIGRLIYQIPLPLCKMFIKETFPNQSPDDFDEETVTTINKFFENNLNVSESARQLFIHRNTLVYRLDKIERLTGLDLRKFEDAITFRIALMVIKYMKYMETLDF